MGYIDFLVSDPSYKSPSKYKMLLELMEACTALALHQGCRIVWAMTTYQIMADIASEMGHDVLDDKHMIIYTHQLTDKKLKQKQYGKKKKTLEQ